MSRWELITTSMRNTYTVRLNYRQHIQINNRYQSMSNLMQFMQQQTTRNATIEAKQRSGQGRRGQGEQTRDTWRWDPPTQFGWVKTCWAMLTLTPDTIHASSFQCPIIICPNVIQYTMYPYIHTSYRPQSQRKGVYPSPTPPWWLFMLTPTICFWVECCSARCKNTSEHWKIQCSINPQHCISKSLKLRQTYRNNQLFRKV